MSEIRNAEGALCAIVNVPKEKTIPLKVYLLKEIEEELSFESTAQRDERILSYLYEEELKSDAKDRAQKKFKKLMRCMTDYGAPEVHVGRQANKSAQAILKVSTPRTEKAIRHRRSCEGRTVYDL